MPDHQEPLVKLGLTQLEASIYRFLLTESPATGYRIAQGLGKPAANVYSALETLRAKSALLVREGETRLFSPVPVDELLDRLQREFAQNLEDTREALRSLPGPAGDDGIYHLRGSGAVLDRCRAMLGNARVKVLIDAFPQPLEALRQAIHDCTARDLYVGIKCYGSTDMEASEIVLDPQREDVRQRWPVQWLNLVVDAEELLIAVFDDSGQEVIEAIWTRNPWIAVLSEGTLGQEIAFTAVRAADQNLEQLQRTVRRFEATLHVETPGRERIRRLLGLNQSPETRR